MYAMRVIGERLNIAIKENMVTPEVEANGYGVVVPERFAKAIEQIGLTYTFKTKPNPNEIFDPSFLPPAAERKVE